MISISTRLDESILKQIDELAREIHLERSALIRKFILDGLQNALLEKNIRAVERGELSIEQAASESGVNIYVLLDTARKLGAQISLDESTLEYEKESLKRHLKIK